MTAEEDQVVLDGMWQVIKAMHHGLQTTATTLEWFFDVTAPEHRAKAAQAMDAFNAMMKSCYELVGPIQKIMEGDQ